MDRNLFTFVNTKTKIGFFIALRYVAVFLFLLLENLQNIQLILCFFLAVVIHLITFWRFTDARVITTHTQKTTIQEKY